MKKISLAAARVNAGLTQNDVKEALGVSKNSVINWEKGRSYPTEEQLQKYCAVCGCQVSDVDCKYTTLASA